MGRETYVRQEQHNQEAMQLRQVFRNEINEQTVQYDRNYNMLNQQHEVNLERMNQEHAAQAARFLDQTRQQVNSVLHGQQAEVDRAREVQWSERN